MNIKEKRDYVNETEIPAQNTPPQIGEGEPTEGERRTEKKQRKTPTRKERILKT